MSSSRTVYLVEDDEVARQSTEALLTIRGYWVEVFETAEDLLASDATFESGLVLADYRLPGLSGLQLFEELRRRGVVCPILLVSGHADNDVIAAAMDAGVSEFLLKPVSPNQLEERMQYWLSRQATP